VCPAPKVFRYIGRRLFGEVYTLCFKGGPQTAVPMRTGAATGKNCFTLRSMAGSWPSPFVSLLPQRQSRQAHRFRCSPRVWAELLSYPYNQQYDVSPDGQRFLINTIIDEVPSPIRVILNWFLTRPLLLGNFVPGVFTPVEKIIRVIRGWISYATSSWSLQIERDCHGRDDFNRLTVQ